MTEEDEFGWGSVDWGKFESDLAEDRDDTLQVPVSLTAQMLAKRLVWDLAPCDIAVEVSELMGLPATSDEVDSMEHEEAHNRLQAVAILGPYLHALIPPASNAVVGSMIVRNELELDDEDRADAVVRTAALVTQTTVAILAELIDLGAIRLPHFVLVKDPT